LRYFGVKTIQLEKLVVEAIRANAQPDVEPEGDLSVAKSSTATSRASSSARIRSTSN
jgi:hypothetical protein